MTSRSDTLSDVLFDEHCGVQTIGIDDDKYCSAQTDRIAVDKQKQYAIRRTI